MEVHAFATQDAMFSPLASYHILVCCTFWYVAFSVEHHKEHNNCLDVCMIVCMLYSVLLYSLSLSLALGLALLSVRTHFAKQKLYFRETQ